MLYLNQRRVVCDQKTGTAVPEIMKADMPQAIFFQELLKIVRDNIRFHHIAVPVTAHIDRPQSLFTLQFLLQK